MAEEVKSTSWWQTLPGVLTAIAAAITAVSGLIAALYQAGLVGKKDAPPPSRTAAPAGQEVGSTASHAPASREPPHAATQRPVEMPDGRSVTMRDGTGQQFQYTIVSASREPASAGKQILRLRVRVWTNAPGGVVFWSDSFRLRMGEARLKPVSALDELAARDETREADVEFEIDASARDAVLAITVGGLNFEGNTRDLRLVFP
jgi:hypothetical protein